MKIERVLVPYHSEEEKKRLEDYLLEKTGRKTDLGPIQYGGKLTLQTIDIDLTKIGSTNITCAPYFPGLHFKNVNEFIEWHSRISDMHYPEAVKEATDPADVIALYYQEEKDEISYICFRMFYQWEIEKYLVSSDGKALPFENKGRKYWLLLSKTNGNMIMFTKTDSSNTPFMHISSDLKDLEFFRYLISM